MTGIERMNAGFEFLAVTAGVEGVEKDITKRSSDSGANGLKKKPPPSTPAAQTVIT